MLEDVGGVEDQLGEGTEVCLLDGKLGLGAAPLENSCVSGDGFAVIRQRRGEEGDNITDGAKSACSRCPARWCIAQQGSCSSRRGRGEWVFATTLPRCCHNKSAA